MAVLSDELRGGRRFRSRWHRFGGCEDRVPDDSGGDDHTEQDPDDQAGFLRRVSRSGGGFRGGLCL